MKKYCSFYVVFWTTNFFFTVNVKKFKEFLVVSQIVKIIFANTLSAFPKNMGRNPTLQHILIFHQNFDFGTLKFWKNTAYLTLFFEKIYFFTTNVKNLNWGRKRWTDLCLTVTLTDKSCHMAWHDGMHLVNIDWNFISDLHGMAYLHGMACHLYLTGMAWYDMFWVEGARKVCFRRFPSVVRRNPTKIPAYFRQFPTDPSETVGSGDIPSR